MTSESCNQLHLGEEFTRDSDFTIEPGRGQCHVYMVHQSGKIYWKPNQQWEGNSTDAEGDTISLDNRLTLIYCSPKEKSAPKETSSLKEKPHPNEPWDNTDEIPTFFARLLNHLCEPCKYKKDKVWRNLRRSEQHFDSCVRYFEASENKKTVVTSQKRCFLKLHAFKVPCISTEKITFSMVYHIRSDGDCFVATENSKTNNKEHMFAFIEGITSEQIGHLLLGQLNHWQDDVTDCLDRSSGITPGLLTAAVLAYHGYVVAREITGLFTELQKFDDTLSKTIDELENDTNGSGDAATIKIQVLNKRLIEINRKLTGTRSIMHFLAESADLLVNGIIPFDDYVTGRFQTLEKSFHELDSYKERIRDHDKLMMVSKSMFQYKTDIESLQQHININVGMISNLIAGRDRSIQLKISGFIEKDSQALIAISNKVERDGHSMFVIAVLTTLFLPGTFVAILLTTPMFDWLNPDGKLIVKLPFEIYFGATFPLMIILILFMSLRKWLCRAVDLLPHGTLQLRLRTSRFYQDAKKDNEREEISDSGTSAKAGATNDVGTRGETTGRNSVTNGTFQKVAESRTRSATSLSIAEQGVYGVHGGG